MQRAKDTFYIALRDRIAALNPARTVLVRGVTRPGVLVEENELVTAVPLTDIFRLRWNETSMNTQQTMPLVSMRCEIRYATAGNADNGSMDRGRLMAAMDAELAAALNKSPQNTIKTDYTATPPAPMRTNIFWNDVNFGAITVNGEQLEQIATIEVFSYQEAGLQ
ncbi:hypothetical protein [Edaphobacter albus]|uniref:hypothetical protein n=1 Tax=Edaphobacter sp. 4G125 TaxID=2763071 RepID=UPI001645B4FD|nr:hypothetical protein [Edaphobacter sp. 4G125]QNI36819.1 hypothetical protein H7846_00265 [Edaphobacter sp. 4G125]